MTDEKFLPHGRAESERPPPHAIIRFLKKVHVSPFPDTLGCWMFKACRDSKGYGRFNWRGKSYPAHRFAYLAFNGSITEGMDIDHICCNTSCVNPSHLRELTRAENTANGNKARVSEPPF